MKISLLFVVCLVGAACSKYVEGKENVLQDLRELLTELGGPEGSAVEPNELDVRSGVPAPPKTCPPAPVWKLQQCVAVPLGMQSGAIPDSAITASSTHPTCSTSNARLYSESQSDQSQPGWVGAWCADYGQANANQWLQVDLGSEKPVAGVITQGRSSMNNDVWRQHVTSYKLGFSTDGRTFSTYTSNLGQEKVFSGNSDQETEVRHLLDAAITARYVRFLPQTWIEWVTMRAEILGMDCTGGD